MSETARRRPDSPFDLQVYGSKVRESGHLSDARTIGSDGAGCKEGSSSFRVEVGE